MKLPIRIVHACAAVMIAAVSAVGAQAAVNLQRVQVTEGSRVDLIFDGKVDPSAIQSEFFNDTVQLSMDGVNVYPAKISTVSGPELVKIFAYQYSPGLVRCRFTIKGKAEDFRERIKISGEGKVLSVRFGADSAKGKMASVKGSASAGKMDAKSGEDSITLTSRRPDRAIKTGDAGKEQVQAPVVTADEKTLLQRVLGGGDEEPREVAKADSNEEAKRNSDSASPKGGMKDQRSEKSVDTEKVKASGSSHRLTSAPDLPSPFRSLGMLAAICGALGLVVLARKGLKGGAALKKIEGHKGLGGLLGNLGLARGDRLIEVLSNHSLGPRKSIAVVRVGGRRLVLGVTNENINLITAVDGGAETSFEAALAGAAVGVKTGPARDEGAVDLEALARESAERPELFKPAASTSSGATSAGAPRYAEPSLFKAGALEMQEDDDFGSSAALASRDSEPRNSAIRDRIRSRLGGMKPL